MDGLNINSSSPVSAAPSNTSTNSTLTGSNVTARTLPLPSASVAHDDGPNTAAVAVTLTIIILVVVVVVLALTLRHLRRKGKLSTLLCWKPMSRSRKSSISSSRRALAEQDDVETTVHSKKSRGQADEMFTIEDLEDPADPQEGREEYFYDEVFAKSQFEDETTNNAMRQLYSEVDLQPDEEGLSIDFETLGIKLESYSLDPPSGRGAV